MKKSVYILVLCECSQEITLAFRAKGALAYSCDIKQVERRGDKRFHIMMDATKFLDGLKAFHTMDGRFHRVPRWDLIIAHPPCTYLCKVSSVHLLINGLINEERLEKMYEARSFFLRCLDAPAPFVCVENPIPMKRAQLPHATTFVQPSWFGHKYTKKTLLWLKNLPPIMPQLIYPNPKQFVRASRGKYRSRTFHGIALAIAEQWFPIVKSYVSCKHT